MGGAAPQTFNNNGTFIKSGGAGTSSITTAFNNTGTVNANMGTLSFSGTTFTQASGLTRLGGGSLAGGTLNVGQNIVYTVTVANAGPDAATAVVLTDTLPAAVTFVSAVASQGACGAPVGVTLTCNLGTIASGGNHDVHRSEQH